MALSTLDMGIIVAYLVFAVGLGVYFSRTNKTTEAFFLGSRGLPGWALGLSLLSTSISSNTFLAIPSYSYASDFGLLLKDAVLPLVAVPAAVLFVPFFRQEGRIGEWQARKPWGRNRRRGDTPWGSAFEFLEDRFGPFCRRYAGVCYVCIQMVRTASILYLISIPVSLFTGLSGEFAIVSTGVCVPKPLLSPGRSRLTHAGAGELRFVAFYSTLGGVRAVVFTDVVQAVILLGGGIGTVIIVAMRLPEGLATLMADGEAAQKFNLVEGAGEPFEFRSRTVRAAAKHAGRTAELRGAGGVGKRVGKGGSGGRRAEG